MLRSVRRFFEIGESGYGRKGVLLMVRPDRCRSSLWSDLVLAVCASGVLRSLTGVKQHGFSQFAP